MNFPPEYLVAFSVGLLGSLHCLGMCGPIALLTPPLFPGVLGRILGGLVYHLGRIFTYSTLGLIAGLLGAGFAFFKWQQVISLILGGLIVLYVLLPIVFQKGPLFKLSTRINSNVKNVMSGVISRKGILGILSIGLVNGMLPCGLVYIGLAGSLDMNEPLKGAMFMIFFGLGTAPMLTGVHLLGSNLKGGLKSKLSKLIPVFTLIVGILFIIRGLGLGIPYLSPKLVAHGPGVECHLPEHRHKYYIK